MGTVTALCVASGCHGAVQIHTGPHTPVSEGSKRLSEISITLPWVQQGQASNRFRMFLQAL